MSNDLKQSVNNFNANISLSDKQIRLLAKNGVVTIGNKTFMLAPSGCGMSLMSKVALGYGTKDRLRIFRNLISSYIRNHNDFLVQISISDANED